MSRSGATCRVVICDDSTEYRTVLGLMLRVDAGIEVVGEADDGDTCIELVRRTQPDIVLLDVSMPRVDGIDAVPELHAAAPDCRVIMLTGYGSAEVRERSLSAGADDYLEKTEDFSQILTAVQSHCSALG